MRAPSNKMSSSTGTGTACCSKVGIKRGPWTAEEDEILADFVKKEGEGRWRTLPKRAGLQRCGKSCRLRWMNYLRPSVKRGHIAPDEEDLILRLHRLLGNRWSLIAGRIPGRTDNEIKNYWNTHLSKKLIRQGIDPRTHKPLITNYNINNDPDPNPNDPTNTASIVNIPEITSTSTTPDPAALENMGQKMEMHEKMTAFGEEDGTLSSFLDSLLNDDGVGTQQDPLITTSSLLQPFDLAFWEAEFPTTTASPSTTTDRSMNIKYY